MPGLNDFVDFFDMVGQTGWSRSLQRTLIHWIGPSDQDVALDVGCGPGWFTLQLAQRSRWTTGVDISESMIRRAQLNAEDFGIDNVTFMVGDIRRLPFVDASFDLVTCVDLLFLFEEREPPLRELIRVCSPSGQVILLNPSGAMNPWTARQYCDRHGLSHFDRDSLLSWSTAASRHQMLREDDIRRMALTCGARLTDAVPLLNGLVSLVRIVPESRTADVSA
ncbi:MAG: class I SAM-dependent methyltransferase [Alicyclobacillaceae bacterium]|nr:class I SAM-dependent methyltransferase [Alicyclobacillaceae bacterium]